MAHGVVCSEFAKKEVGELTDEIYERLGIRIETTELYEDGKRLLVLSVPSRPVGRLLRFEGVPLMRTGESLRAMFDAEIFRILSEQEPDFSAKICEGLTIEDLDKEAIAEMKTQYARKQENPLFQNYPDEQVLSDLDLLKDGKLNYAALILLGKSEAIRKYLLEKEGTLRQGYCRNGEEKGIPAKDLKVPGKGIVEFLDFAKDTLDPQTLAGLEKNGTYLKFGDQLYLAPKGMPSVKGLKVLRPGLHLGTVKKNRMEPSHALALALKKEQVRYTADLASDGEVIRGYLNGGTFSYEGEKGWYLIMADGFSTGWGKLAGGIMKNHYPKGLRNMWYWLSIRWTWWISRKSVLTRLWLTIRSLLLH